MDGWMLDGEVEDISVSLRIHILCYQNQEYGYPRASSSAGQFRNH